MDSWGLLAVAGVCLEGAPRHAKCSPFGAGLRDGECGDPLGAFLGTETGGPQSWKLARCSLRPG